MAQGEGLGPLTRDPESPPGGREAPHSPTGLGSAGAAYRCSGEGCRAGRPTPTQGKTRMGAVRPHPPVGYKCMPDSRRRCTGRPSPTGVGRQLRRAGRPTVTDEAPPYYGSSGGGGGRTGRSPPHQKRDTEGGREAPNPRERTAP